jgi:nucleotide-binding universal stress UspA family protein
MQIDHVLVPIDFSPLSRFALGHALSLADRVGARLTLLHVVESSKALSVAFPDETAEIEKDHFDQSHRILAALVDGEDREDLEFETMVKSGDIKDQILTTIREKGVDLVVMGTHGRGLLARSIIGSVTHDVLRSVEIPALTVSRARQPFPFDSMLVATDLSESSQTGSRFAIDLARRLHDSIIVVHAVEVGVEGGAEAAEYLGESRRKEALKGLDELKTDASGQNVRLESVVSEGVAADIILNAAEQRSADFILMTIPKSALTPKTVLGSTAERVLQESHIPVLTVPVLMRDEAERADQPSAA